MLRFTSLARSMSAALELHRPSQVLLVHLALLERTVALRVLDDVVGFHLSCLGTTRDPALHACDAGEVLRHCAVLDEL